MSENGTAITVAHEPNSMTVSGSMRINGVGEVFALAKHLAKAVGFVPQALLGNEGAIAAAIMTGIELGIGPMEALRSLHVIEGKVTMAADFMLSRAIRAGVECVWAEKTGTRAVLRLRRRGGVWYEQTFTIEDAKRAGLTDKKIWQRYPAAMLRARAISAAMRAYCPDVLGAGIYTADEVTSGEVIATVGEAVTEGEIVDPQTGEVQPAPIPAQLAKCETLEQALAWVRDRRAKGAALDRGRIDKIIVRLVGDAPESELASVRKMVDEAIGVQPDADEPSEDDRDAHAELDAMERDR